MREPTEGSADAGRRKVAHEIRNSLGAIRTATELLERRYQPEGKEQRLFQVILKEIDRLDEITLVELGPKGS
ncbi:MAG: histidine kinase dimerization/phospho-acceptor domain-containing protein [Candidatus Binatia bacterium]